mmetsp:Transcript_28339/g.60071  ORF Transcript_28339/g.60071 Transcript_28339/m.60071 type:complete len:128 (-) Transcript_28339:77-460(-)
MMYKFLLVALFGAFQHGQGQVTGTCAFESSCSFCTDQAPSVATCCAMSPKQARIPMTVMDANNTCTSCTSMCMDAATMTSMDQTTIDLMCEVCVGSALVSGAYSQHGGLFVKSLVGLFVMTALVLQA